MKKIAIFLIFICLLSFSSGQVLVSPEPKVAPVPPKSIGLPKEVLVLKFRGTVKDIEREFYTTIEQGIDVIRDRKTNKLITGPFTVTTADGKVVGILNLLKGKKIFIFNRTKKNVNKLIKKYSNVFELNLNNSKKIKNSCIINVSPEHNHKKFLKLVDFNEIKYICDCVIEKKSKLNKI